MNLRKYPAEIRTVTFDFSGAHLPLSNPVCTSVVVSGKIDAAQASMKVGSPQVQDGQVLQQFGAGLPGNTYQLTCEVDDNDGEHLVAQGLLVIESS